jgi:hypothetical protein
MPAYKNYQALLADQGYALVKGIGWAPQGTPSLDAVALKGGGPDTQEEVFNPYNISLTNFKEQGFPTAWTNAWREEYNNISGKLESAKQALADAKAIKDKEGIADANMEVAAWTQVQKSLNVNNTKLTAIKTAASKNQGQWLATKPETPTPTTTESMRDVFNAYYDILPGVYSLEAEAQKEFTAASGAAQRAEFFKNIAALEDTGEIAAIRDKIESESANQARINSAKTDAEKIRLQALLPTQAEKDKLAAFTAQTQGMTAFQRQAAVEGAYSQAAKGQEFAMLQSRLPQYQQLMQQYMPGSQEVIQGLGQLGQSNVQDAQRGLQLADYLAPFRQQVTGANGAPVLDANGNPMLDTTGGLRQLDLTSGMAGISPYEQGKFMQGIEGPRLDSTLLNINQGLVNQYMGTMPGVAQGAAEMGRIANEKLKAGANLTPAELEAAKSASREAFAARGTALGPQAVTTEVLARTELARQREAENLALGQSMLGNVAALYAPAMAQTLQRQSGAEQYELGAQAQMFGQGMAQEELSRAAQAQRFGQAQSLAGVRQQEFATNLAAAAQAQNMAAQAAQARQGYAANAAQIASGVLGTQQQALSPILAAYYNTPGNLGVVSGATGQAANSFSLGGMNIVNPLDPTATSINMYPSQMSLQERMGGMQMASAERVAQAQLKAAQASARRSSGGGFLGLF